MKYGKLLAIMAVSAICAAVSVSAPSQAGGLGTSLPKLQELAPDSPLRLLLRVTQNDSPDDWSYSTCVSGCDDSYEYCQEHQSHLMNCSAKRTQCYAWCNEDFDQATSGGVSAPGANSRPRVLSPKAPGGPKPHIRQLKPNILLKQKRKAN